MYYLRFPPCFLKPDLLQKYDSIVTTALEKTCNIHLTPAAYNQASLPTSMGGLVIESATLLAPSVYRASAVACKETSKLILRDSFEIPNPTILEVVDFWYHLSNCPEKPVTYQIQKSWTQQCHEFKLPQLKPNDDENTRARFGAFSRKCSGAWLNALPCANLGLKMTNNQKKIAVALRLGIRKSEPHLCVCGHQVDSDGTHGLSCTKSDGCFSRHTALNVLIKQSLGSVHVPTNLEPPGLRNRDG